MHGLQVERRAVGQSLSRQLAGDVCSEVGKGRVVIVAEKPVVLLSSTKKQWLKLIRRLQRQRSSTLNPIKIAKLTDQIIKMQQSKFSAKPSDDLLHTDITFAVADDLVRFPPICSVIYVTYTFEREKLHMLTSWMPRNSGVVIYEQD